MANENRYYASYHAGIAASVEKVYEGVRRFEEKRSFLYPRRTRRVSFDMQRIGKKIYWRITR